MSPEKFSIEIDTKFVENFFGLADMPPPRVVDLKELENALFKIKSKVNSLNSSTPEHISSEQAKSDFLIGGIKNNAAIRPKTVLIVDDLGIITYQLDVLFKKMGFEVVISHEIYDAIEKYKKQDFGYAVVDLFIPTEREGFILLDELKKLSLLCKLNTKFIVMTASSKTEFKSKCLNRGADFYIQKAAGWQKEIMEACM